MGRAMRTMRRAQWQRVGRRASGAGLAWHIWQEQNVRVRQERQDYVRASCPPHMAFILRDLRLFQIPNQ